MRKTAQNEVLIVEDEPKLAQLLIDYFVQADFTAVAVSNGDDVMPYLEINCPDAILLDVMLPGKDGWTLCREIREKYTVPILMVTARVEEIDRLLGLEIGADDYICKPFSPREVVARVKAILRRMESAKAKDTGWDLQEATHEFSIGVAKVSLSAIEFQMMKKLCQDPGRIFSRDLLMTDIYSDNRIVSERTIDSHVKKLRRKLANSLPHDDLIESVYGVGYRFVPPKS